MIEDLFSQPTRSSDPESSDDAAYSFDGKPDRYKRYRLPDPDTGKPGGYTRATTFAKTISDTFILSLWGQRMVGKGVAMRPDLIAAFASTPFGEREKLNSLAEQAKTTAGAKEGANLGSALHSFTEQHDRGERPDVPAPWDRDLKAYAALLDQEGLEVVPELIERIVLWQRFGIAGTFDRIVRVTREIVLRIQAHSADPKSESAYRLVTLAPGDLVVLDLKTGRDLEYGWIEIAVQLTCYARAERIFDKTSKEWIDGPDFLGVRKDVALVVHLPTGKGRAELHAIDLGAGHELAELCARVRNARKVKGLAQSVAVVEIGDEHSSPDDVVAIARTATFEERIVNARTVGDLATIRRDALVAKAWTPAVELKALARRDAILADSAATTSTAGA